VEAVTKGLANLDRHLANVRDHYGLPVVVSLNHFLHDTEAEIKVVQDHCAAKGFKAVVAKHWAHGSAGAQDLVKEIMAAVDTNQKGDFKFVYPDSMSLFDKVAAIATKIYGVGDLVASTAVRNKLDKWSKEYGNFPVCVAKTQMSFSSDAGLRGAPSGHKLEIKEVRINVGARFVVAVCGDIMTMPGLPTHPSAERIDISDDGVITGLF